VPYLDTARSAPARAGAAVYRQSSHQLALLGRPARASQLELASGMLRNGRLIALAAAFRLIADVFCSLRRSLWWLARPHRVISTGQVPILDNTAALTAGVCVLVDDCVGSFWGHADLVELGLQVLVGHERDSSGALEPDRDP